MAFRLHFLYRSIGCGTILKNARDKDCKILDSSPLFVFVKITAPMQGDLKKTYTRSYRISMFKRKMKKRATVRQLKAAELGTAEVEMDTICCSSLPSSPEGEGEVLRELHGAQEEEEADGGMCRAGHDHHEPHEDRLSTSNGMVKDGCDLLDQIDASAAGLPKHCCAQDSSFVLGTAGDESHVKRLKSPGADSHLYSESAAHDALPGCLRTPTKILLLTDDGNIAGEAESANSSKMGDFGANIESLKSGICSLSQSLEDINACRAGLERACSDLASHHDSSMRQISEQAVALAECEGKQSRASAEKDSMMAMHLTNLISKAIQLLDSISLGAISQGVRNLDALVSGMVPRSQVESRDMAIKTLEEELQSVTVKAGIQEEQIEYLVKQIGILKKSNHMLEISLGLIAASGVTLYKHVSDFETDYNRVKDLFSTAQSQSRSRNEELLADLRSVRDRVESLRSEIDIGASVSSIRDLLKRSVEEIVSAYESQLEATKASRLSLEEQIQELGREVSELRERNASLSESNKYMEEEIELKSTYARDMESTLDELMKSNKFYEDQLIKSDDALRSFKEKQIKSSMGFASEVEKMRKAHLKESGMLRLRIEELELELASKNN